MTHSTAVAVITTYNRLGAVLALVRSIRERWATQPPVYVGLVDQCRRERPGLDAMSDVEIVAATALDVPDFWWRAVTSGPAELCLLLKPSLLRHVLARGHDTVVACDPDLQFFDDGSPLADYAPHADLVVIPRATDTGPASLLDAQGPSADVDVAEVADGVFVVRRRPGALAFLDAWEQLGTGRTGADSPDSGPSEQQALGLASSYVDDLAQFTDPRFALAYDRLEQWPLRWSQLDGGPADEWRLDGRRIVCCDFRGLAWSADWPPPHANRYDLPLDVNLQTLCRDRYQRLLAAHAGHYTTAGYEYDEVDGRSLAGLRDALRPLEDVAIPALRGSHDVRAVLSHAARLIGRTSILPAYLERILDRRADLQGLDDPEQVCRTGMLLWATRWLRHEDPCGLLWEYDMDTAFHRRQLEVLAAEVARGPLGLSPEHAAAALLDDRPALLERLGRDDPRRELLEAIEVGAYRYPAFDPAVCLRLIYETRADLQAAFPDPLGHDFGAFRGWLSESLPLEFILPPNVRELASTIDPQASLARLLSVAQRCGALRREIVERGLGAWAVPQLVQRLPQAPGYEASDLVVVMWWLEKHGPEARVVIDRTFVPSLVTRRADSYLDWWCRRNAGAPDTLRDFVATLPAALDRTRAAGELEADGERFVSRFVAACQTARGRRAPHLEADPCGINVFGYFKSPTRLGATSSRLADAFQHAGYRPHRIVLADVAMDAELRPDDLHPDFAFTAPRNIVLTSRHDAFDVFPPEFFVGRETSAYVTGSAREARPWRERLARYHRLFAPARVTAEAIADEVGRPCEPIPRVVDVDRTASVRWPRASFGIPADTFVAGLVVDAATAFEPQNPLAAVRAVAGALAGRDVLLVIAVVGGARASGAADVHTLGQEARRHSLAHLIVAGDMPKARRDALIACLDLYVSLPRGESAGETMVEAMLLGVPVVTTGAGEAAELVTEDNAYPVTSRDIVVRFAHGVTPFQAAWREPDLGEAIERCRRVYERPDEAKLKSARAQTDVEAVASVQAVAGRLRTLFA